MKKSKRLILIIVGILLIVLFFWTGSKFLTQNKFNNSAQQLLNKFKNQSKNQYDQIEYVKYNAFSNEYLVGITKKANDQNATKNFYAFNGAYVAKEIDDLPKYKTESNWEKNHNTLFTKNSVILVNQKQVGFLNKKNLKIEWNKK
ncbi:MAG: hypothetical protein ABF635_10765 [Liquorilactobacillus satsumensis]|uniref:hypothetical protein n=1 Tax=Lactobacillaceae TaxID=33958 RepID=UPI0039ED5189